MKSNEQTFQMKHSKETDGSKESGSFNTEMINKTTVVPIRVPHMNLRNELHSFFLFKFNLKCCSAVEVLFWCVDLLKESLQPYSMHYSPVHSLQGTRLCQHQHIYNTLITSQVYF